MCVTKMTYVLNEALSWIVACKVIEAVEERSPRVRVNEIVVQRRVNWVAVCSAHHDGDDDDYNGSYD